MRENSEEAKTNITKEKETKHMKRRKKHKETNMTKEKQTNI